MFTSASKFKATKRSLLSVLCIPLAVFFLGSLHQQMELHDSGNRALHWGRLHMFLYMTYTVGCFCAMLLQYSLQRTGGFGEFVRGLEVVVVLFAVLLPAVHSLAYVSQFLCA